MNKLKPGDRVRVYGGPTPTIGTVQSITGDTVAVSYFDEGPMCLVSYHYKQVRRLKPKKKLREIWVNDYPGGLGNIYYISELKAEKASCDINAVRVKFREVRKK